MFWKDPTPTPEEGLKGCPDDFPNPDPGAGFKGDDVCRNEGKHGFNKGWTCPFECDADADPAGYNWCKMPDSDNPCRFTGKQWYPSMKI